MKTGIVTMIIGANRAYCFIKAETGERVLAAREVFKDPEAFMVGVNVKFQVRNPGEKKLKAIDVEAA